MVRSIGENRFEIIAGERRWRASQLARLEVVPCLVKDVADEAAVAIALIENIQREDLNAIEEAVALQRLLTEFELTSPAGCRGGRQVPHHGHQPAASQPAQRGREALCGTRRPRHGHARALLALSGQAQSELAKLVAQKGLTVRDTEKLVQKHWNRQNQG